MDTTFNIWNALFSLSGVALGGAIGFFSAKRISDKTAQAAAAAKFRATFAPALAYLQVAEAHHSPAHQRPKAGRFLKESYFAHASAIEEYMPFISKERRAEFRHVWSAYQELEPLSWDGDAPLFIGEAFNPANPSKYVLAKLERVISFSED